ncbi:MAG: TIGR00266 family protein [Spirochaetaceae bacterium 4572_59]|nr:MAG: TIGR00266 family protein [Spirochaetaceae bacterium 4572_59]
MKASIQGNPSFSHVHIDLDPGESFVAESGAMQSMSAEMSMKAVTNGGFFSALAKKWFGRESFFVNYYSNKGSSPMRLTISQDVPGDILALKLDGTKAICLQKGSYLAHAGDVKLKSSWAGFISWFSGEGLIKLKASGQGTVWFGAYGGIIERKVDGDLKVDDGHLVAYDPGLKLKIALAGGLFSSFFGGEGFVTRLVGSGTVYIQTRSLSGLASWLNPKFK